MSYEYERDLRKAVAAVGEGKVEWVLQNGSGTSLRLTGTAAEAHRVFGDMVLGTFPAHSVTAAVRGRTLFQGNGAAGRSPSFQ